MTKPVSGGTSSGVSAKPFAGQHAVVTGGARGIGAAIAEALAARGADITITGRTASTLDTAKARIADAHGVRVGAMIGDAADEAAMKAGFAAAAEAFGAPSILVNNAGRGDSAPFKRMDVAFLQSMLDVNLISNFVCTQAALPAMLEAGYGRIISIASSASLVGYRYVSGYVAAKHAVLGLTRSLALETATKGVTVNAVCPGYVETDLTGDTIANIVEKTGMSAADARGQLSAGNPQGRLVEPEEVANAVCWLALAESHSITGQAIAVAGGEIM